jgi:hypothetical protein
MKNVVNVVAAINKAALFSQLDESDFSPLELSFARKYRDGYMHYNLTFESTLVDQVVMVWDSAVGVSIAWIVGKKSDIQFHSPYIYQREGRLLIAPARTRFPLGGDNSKCLHREFETIKVLIKDFFPELVPQLP